MNLKHSLTPDETAPRARAAEGRARRGPSAAVWVLPALAALLLTGCGGAGEDTDDDAPEEPDSDIAQTELDEPTDDGQASGDDGDADDGETTLPEPEARQVEEAPELVGEVQATWEDYEEISETELEVMFYSGNLSCYGVRSVVEEDAEEVRIATVSGRLPEAEDQPCTQEAVYVSVVVELEEPLGDRDVVELQDVELH